MNLPKGSSNGFFSTKKISLETIIEKLSNENFSGFIRITVEAKNGTVETKGQIEDGYLLLMDGKVVGAEFHGREIVRGVSAYSQIRESSQRPGVVDLCKFSQVQAQLAMEENKESFLSFQTPQAQRDESKDEKPTNGEKIPNGHDEKRVSEEERQALLKKFKLSIPDSNYVDNILHDFRQ